ncbi:hypothetical protein O988_06841 [Pseudogymnoascus sp. VKM F-3808]|nr:hypothetical protein O988_06841 [Pseudogymnoascus sp. VKM F-3808]
MKVIQAILSAFWLLIVVHAGDIGVTVNIDGAGGGGGKAVVDQLGEVSFTIPTVPKITFPFGIEPIGTKTIPVVAVTPTETAVIPVDTAANTAYTANTDAITGAIDTPSAVVDTIITSAAVTESVNTPAASDVVDVWVITTVSAYVTICPGPTSFVQGVQTYTITEATTLTITNCPCTISYPAPPVVATTPPSIASVPVPIGTGVNPGGPIVVTNGTSIPVNPPSPLSANSTRTTFIAVTAPPPHATQPLITLGGSTTIIPTPVAETPVPAPNTPVPVVPTPTPATGGADRVFIGLGVAFLSGIIAVFL